MSAVCSHVSAPATARKMTSCSFIARNFNRLGVGDRHLLG